MDAIQVNPQTFSKLEGQVSKLWLERLKSYYECLSPHGIEIYAIVDSLGTGNARLQRVCTGGTFLSGFVISGSKGIQAGYPDNWFRVQARGL